MDSQNSAHCPSWFSQFQLLLECVPCLLIYEQDLATKPCQLQQTFSLI
uniref:Uncharacterized protein n=1 Tax=Arundo donax TaxID=35708 RepID=A0A0A9G5A1_ARUDO